VRGVVAGPGSKRDILSISLTVVVLRHTIQTIRLIDHEYRWILIGVPEDTKNQKQGQLTPNDLSNLFIRPEHRTVSPSRLLVVLH
jgi:hypothetical protein